MRRHGWQARLVVAVAAVLLAGCSPAKSVAPLQAPTVTPTAVTSPATSPAGRSDAPTSSSIPDASPRVFQGTPEEYDTRTAECLRDAGWSVQVDGEGGLSADFTPEQRDAFMAAVQACRQQLGQAPPIPPLTQAEIRLTYDYWAHDLRDCLIGLGYTVSEPPTEEQFVDSYPTCTECIVEQGPWNPYSDVIPQMSNVMSEHIAEWDHVNAVCPPVPPQLEGR